MPRANLGADACVYQHQTDETINQANPISGTEYTLLDTTRNVRIIGIIARVDWTVQPTPLEIHVYIDGVAITFTQANPVTATEYVAQMRMHVAPANQLLGAVGAWSNMAFLLEGRSVKITVETTGGTVQTLIARLKWARIP